MYFTYHKFHPLFKGTTQWFLVYLQSFAGTATKRNPYLLAVTPHPFLPTVCANHLPAVCLCGFAYSRYFTEMESYNMWLVVIAFFHLAWCFQGSPMLRHVSVVLHPSLWLYSIPLPGENSFCLSISQLMDIWIVSAFWLLGMMLWSTFIRKFLCRHMCSLLLGRYLQIADLYGNFMFNILKNCQTSKAAAPFYIPTNNVWVCLFLCILTNNCYCLSFYYSHSSVCEGISHCRFDLHFPND